jgi:glutamate--cysteine ligase
MAASAFWLGLLYDADARKLALELLRDSLPSGLNALWEAAGRTGLRTRMGALDLRDISRRLVTAARDALRARRFGEERYLEPLLAGVEACESPAEEILRLWRGPWKGRMEELVSYCGE